MSDINTVTVVGRLVEKPVIKYSKSGTAVSNIRIANNTYMPNSSDQNQSKTNFFTVVVFGKQAENCEKYLDKGRQVIVTGRLDYNTWEDNNGKKNSMVRIIANAVQFIGGKPQDSAGSYKAAPAAAAAEQEQTGENNETAMDDFNATFESPIDDTDDIPF